MATFVDSTLAWVDSYLCARNFAKAIKHLNETVPSVIPDDTVISSQETITHGGTAAVESFLPCLK